MEGGGRGEREGGRERGREGRREGGEREGRGGKGKEGEGKVEQLKSHEEAHLPLLLGSKVKESKVKVSNLNEQ